jgi:cation transport ATPase
VRVPLVVTVSSTWRRSRLPQQRYVPQCLLAELLALVSILVHTHIHLYHMAFFTTLFHCLFVYATMYLTFPHIIRLHLADLSHLQICCLCLYVTGLCVALVYSVFETITIGKQEILDGMEMTLRALAHLR